MVLTNLPGPDVKKRQEIPKSKLIHRSVLVSWLFTAISIVHTAGSDTIFIQIYMDAPPGVPGVSKNQIFFTNKTVEFLR